jgi:type I restriction enzyme S subunit
MSRQSSCEIAVGECLAKIARQPKVKTTDYLESGAYPVIDQGTKFVGGYVNDESLLHTGPLPVVIFGDHNRHIKFVKSPFAVGADGTQLLYPDERFDISYFHYAIRALPLKNYGYERHFKYLKEERLRVWPLDVQRRIAAILSAYDDLIENNTRRIAILEEMARRIYEEWFVSYRFPGHERVRMVKSELGLVPEGWRVVEVQKVVRRLPAGTVYKQADVVEAGSVPVVDQSSAELLGFHSNEPAHRATPGSPVVIFGDHTCKMQLMVVPFSLGPNTVPFVAERLPVHYVYGLVRGLVSTHEYKRHWSDLMKKKVLVSADDLAESYATLVQPMAELIECLRQATRNLCATRDLLLPKLISGDLDVSALPEPEAVAA